MWNWNTDNKPSREELEKKALDNLNQLNIKKLEFKDLYVGKKLTVFAWVCHYDRSYVGEVLEVVCISAPFIIVKHKGKYDKVNKTTSLNMTEVILIDLSEEYIKMNLSDEVNDE